MDLKQTLESKMNSIIVKPMKEQYASSGIRNTGFWGDNIEIRTSGSEPKISCELYAPAYSFTIDEGVSPENVPYSQPSGRGGTSKYIQGLKNYAKTRMGLDDKEALKVAFAIANSQAVRGSKAYQANRNLISSNVTEDNLRKVAQESAEEYTSVIINNILTKIK